MRSRYLTVDECHQLGVEAYAVYGAKVYSFMRPIGGKHRECIPHGSKVYASYVAEADKMAGAT